MLEADNEACTRSRVCVSLQDATLLFLQGGEEVGWQVKDWRG